MSTQSPEPARVDATPAGSPSPSSWWPYVAPMATFLVLTSLEGYLPQTAEGQVEPMWYALAYAAKMAIVTGVLIACRSAWVDLRPRPSWRDAGLAVGIGLAVTVAWVGLQQVPYPRFGEGSTRMGFDPNTLSPGARAAFLAVRLYGLVLLVPVFEELFWRSFVLRLILDADDFARVPIGHVTPTAAVLTSVFFAAVHPEEWLPAVLTGLAWAWLLWKTKRLSACVLSHVVANLGLGIYVLATGQWQFW